MSASHTEKESAAFECKQLELAKPCVQYGLIKAICAKKIVKYKGDYCIKLAHVSEILDSFNRLFYAHESKCSVLGQNGSFIRNVHLSSGPLCRVHCIILYINIFI